MGIIGRQGFKKTIISYIGVLIGLFATLYIYPLEEAMYGLARFLLSIASLFVPILTFGTHSLVVRFFPVFRDKETGHHGFLGFILLISTGSFVVLGSLLYIWRTEFYRLLHSINLDVDVFSENLLETAVLALFISMATILSTYISNFKRIVIPGIFNSIYLKIGLPILILLFYAQVIQEAQFKWGFILIHFFILLSLVIYTFRLGELYLKPDFRFITRGLTKKLANYSIHGVFTTLGATIAFNIDAIMTASMMGFTSTGIFSIANNIAGVISSPFISISEISAPIFAQKLYEGDMENIEKLYKSSSVAMLIVGLGMLITVYVSLDSIFLFSSQYDVIVQGKYVVLLLGLAEVINMAAGLNKHIISYSNLYRWNVILILVLAILNIGFNFAFIPMYGINGAALATLFSMSIFNIAKLIFVWIRFKMQPFTLRHIWVVVIGITAYTLGYFMPDTGYNLLNVILKSGVTLSVFGGLILYFNFSPEITDMVSKLITRAYTFLVRK